MVSRRKKKIQKTLAGHLSATGVDGAPLFATEQAKKDFLDKLKKNEFTKQEIMQIALNPDGDSYSWDKDALPFDARESSNFLGNVIPFDEDKTRELFGRSDIGDNEKIIFAKMFLDSLLMTRGLYNQCEERNQATVLSQTAVRDVVENSPSDAPSWFGREILGHADPGTEWFSDLAQDPVIVLAETEFRDFANNPQRIGQPSVSSFITTPMYTGALGRTYMHIHAGWLILKDISAKPTIQERWDALNGIRQVPADFGLMDYEIPDPTLYEPNFQKSEEFATGGKMQFFWWVNLFSKKGICLIKSSEEYVLPLRFTQEPFFLANQGYYFNEKSLNHAKLLKEKILELKPRDDDTTVDSISFPEIDMVEFIHNLYQSHNRFPSNPDGGFLDDRFDEDGILRLENKTSEYDETNSRTLANFITDFGFRDGTSRHLNDDVKDLGYGFARRYFVGYTKETAIKKIVQLVEELDIDSFYNKGIERLNESYNMIDAIEQEAIAAGIVNEIPEQDFGFSPFTSSSGVDANGNPQVQFAALLDEDGNPLPPNVESWFGFDPGDDC